MWFFDLPLRLHVKNENTTIPSRVSVFKDKCTPSPFVEEFPEDDGEGARAALPDHIYMDAMGFGMGNCCLQVLNERNEQSLSCLSTILLWL